MKILAIETSSHQLSVALLLDGQFLTRCETRPNGGSDVVLPWVNAVMAEAGLSLKQLDGIAFGEGPGGFTGLRLTCGVVQGLAWGADLPVCPVSALLAVAYPRFQNGAERVYACLDARMGEVYTAAYGRSTPDQSECAFIELLTPAVTSPEQMPLPPEPLQGMPWWGAGDGLAVVGEKLPGPLQACLLGDPAARTVSLPHAESVAALAQPVFAAGRGLPAFDAQPRYVRDKVALTTAERLARGGVR